MQDNDEKFDTLAGVIVGAHGVQGTLRVRPATPSAGALLAPTAGAASSSEAASDAKPRWPAWIGPSIDHGMIYHVVSAKRQEPKGGYLVRLAQIGNRTEALSLVGLKIFTPETRRPPLDNDEYFVDDLIGLRAVTESGRELGAIAQVIAQPASDVYETDQDVLIPAVKAFIARIDLPGGLIVVRDVPGLLPTEQDEA